MANKEKKSPVAGKSRDEIIEMIDYGMLYLTDSDLDAFHHKISVIQIRRNQVQKETYSKLDTLDKLDEIDDPVSGI
jgi:hypothetical protein